VQQAALPFNRPFPSAGRSSGRNDGFPHLEHYLAKRAGKFRQNEYAAISEQLSCMF
jgi:hypothetical protein